jgi:hypothetical protein
MAPLKGTVGEKLEPCKEVIQQLVDKDSVSRRKLSLFEKAFWYSKDMKGNIMALRISCSRQHSWPVSAVEIGRSAVENGSISCRNSFDQLLASVSFRLPPPAEREPPECRVLPAPRSSRLKIRKTSLEYVSIFQSFYGCVEE